jgi:hypothetical protein
MQVAAQGCSTPLRCLQRNMQVKESAGSDTRERVHVTAAETHEMSGSKGTANFVMKFAKDSRHECSINVMQLKGITRPITGAARPKQSNSYRVAALWLSCSAAAASSGKRKHQLLSSALPGSTTP